ncbi:MAG: GTP 3',8-cyclase MoaA [Anaerolineae bacterium]|nr:GTP 3',8-cyclase MoaA [Anaerolineae bacterium]NUQ06923.1 GTP 3',8-cyclase MoaA [Anaerolineae bacterium]
MTTLAKDRFGRIINYLRISLTDKCNLRCVYCMPEDMIFRPSSELMQDGELIALVRVFAGLGFHKYRLTGGEPTVRQNVVEIIRAMSSTPGVRDISMTTNGVLLEDLAEPLARAGLTRVNVSVDTLDPARFRRITRWGSLDKVWAGIEAAERAGLTPVKLNVVVVRGFNEGDVTDLAKLTLDHDWQVRFIEMMPFGEVAKFAKEQIVTDEAIRARIADAYLPLELLDDGRLDGEARLYRFPGAKGAVGFISSVTQPFCASCNRARLTADGVLRLCLLRDREVDLLTPLRAGASEDELRQIILDNIWWKPWGHDLAHDVIPLNRVMSQIGG